MKLVKLGDHISLVGGGTPSKDVDSYWNGDIPWASVKDFKSDYISSTVDKITEEGVKNSATRIIPAGTLLIATRMAVGKVAFAQMDVAINQDLKAITCNSSLYSKFLFYLLKSKSGYFDSVSSGATVQGIKINHILDIQIPLPPLDTQKKIAAILDAADDYRQKTKTLIDKYDQLAQSLFLDMFGDPGVNEKKWDKLLLKEVTLRFSDGPFGSNLKTEHYNNIGVQVIRLQNIGVNEFIEGDIAFIKNAHYENCLKKHTCYPGDVVIATMGTPNIRACIIPQHVKISINKADCVLCRVNLSKANNIYISHLINQEGFLAMAQTLIHGQTRARISSGQIAKMLAPIPPIALQNKFAERIQLIEAQKQQAQASLQKAENLFNSLLQRAFSVTEQSRSEGELVS